MREHQIVLNLKAAQFEEIQRLARAEGVSSVSVFVKQKLFSTLGLAGALKRAKSIESSELKLVTSELRRLHRELQLFLADTSPINTLDNAFTINRLNDSDPSPHRSLYPNDRAGQDEGGKQILAYTEPMPPPDEINSFAEVDDLENLAERAFAISPRLGAMEEPPPKPFPDPLRELLAEAFNTFTEDDELEEEQLHDRQTGYADGSGADADIQELDQLAPDETENQLLAEEPLEPDEDYEEYESDEDGFEDEGALGGEIVTGYAESSEYETSPEHESSLGHENELGYDHVGEESEGHSLTGTHEHEFVTGSGHANHVNSDVGYVVGSDPDHMNEQLESPPEALPERKGPSPPPPPLPPISGGPPPRKRSV